jgi:hypothetical protein
VYRRILYTYPVSRGGHFPGVWRRVPGCLMKSLGRSPLCSRLRRVFQPRHHRL